MASPAPLHHATTSDRTRGSRLLLLALILAGLAYAGTLRFGFAYDDGPQIIANPTLTSWHYLPSLYLGHTWKFMMPTVPGNYYRPVFMSWLLVNRILFGLNPVPWHATTILLHLIATWLAFVVAREILGNSTQAGFAAVLFAVHPIHIESVAWISGVTDPLMAVFVFAGLLVWIRSDGRSPWWKLLAAVFYFLGCLTKETALPLVVAVVAFEFYFRQHRKFLQSLLFVWPLWITAGVYLVVRALALRGLMHPVGLPWREVALSLPMVIWAYLRLVFWPVNLSVFYDIFPVTSIYDWRCWLAFIALAAVAVLTWRYARSRAVVSFSLLWFVLFLAPAIVGISVFLVGDWVHDRYLYLPSFGICLLLGYLLALVPGKRKLFGYPAVSVALTTGVISLMCFSTAWQEQYWKDSTLLFVHAVNEAPSNVWAKNSLAGELFRNGDNEDARRMYEAAFHLDPDNWKNNADFGNMLYRTGDYRAADEHYTRALQVIQNANAFFNQGMSRFNYGNYSGAETSFENALRYNPEQKQAHFWLGMALQRTGNLDAARNEFLAEIHQHSEVEAEAQHQLQQLATTSQRMTQAK